MPGAEQSEAFFGCVLVCILDITDVLCDDIHERLVQKSLRFKSVGIALVTKDMRIRSRSMSLENPTNDREVIKRIVKDLLERFLAESEIEVRRVGVRLFNFIREHDQETQRQITSFLR